MKWFTRTAVLFQSSRRRRALASICTLAALCPLIGAQVPTGSDVAAADALAREHHYSDAMDRYEAALTANPADNPARRGEVAAAAAWAAHESSEQNGPQAMEILERAIKRLPDEPALLISFGLEAIALGQFPIAEQALHAADKLRPGNPDAIYALARLAIEEQHMPEAEKDLKTYLSLRPKDASAFYGLGYVYQMEQRDDDARKAFQQSIDLQPQQTESYFQLGHMATQAHQDAEAQALLEKVLSRNPNHAGALTDMGELAFRARDYVKAEQYLAAAEKSDPRYPTPHYFRGLALAKLGRKDEAEEELKRGDSRPHATAPSSPSGTETAPAPGGAAAPQPQ